MPEDNQNQTLRWKIDKDIELYRFYLEVSVKAAVFLMVVTGGIASYVLSQPSGAIINVALAFPALVNCGFAILFRHSITEAKRMERNHVDACQKLGVPEFNMRPLKAVCQIFCVMCAVATAGLLILMTVQLIRG